MSKAFSVCGKHNDAAATTVGATATFAAAAAVIATATAAATATDTAANNRQDKRNLARGQVLEF